MSQQAETRNRIVAAAIECIERYGAADATIRRIAEVAAVNSAAISYYFGSKDHLIAAAREATRREATSQVLADIDHLTDELGDLRAAFRQVLIHLLMGVVRYPRITQWHLSAWTEPPLEADAESAEWNAFFNALVDRIRPLLRHRSQADQRLILMQLWLNFILAGLTTRYLSTVSGLDLSTEEGAARWVDCLLDAHIPPQP